MKNQVAADLDGFIIFEDMLLGYTGSETAIVIPEGIRYINEYVFANKPITSVTLPSTLEAISYGAFESTLLTSITLPSTLQYIGNRAFYFTPLTSITLPNQLKYIGGNAFGSTQLTSLVIPSSVEYIYQDAFNIQTLDLTQVTFENPDTLKRAEEMFEVTYDDQGFFIVDGVLLSIQQTDEFELVLSGRVVIPEGVKHIGVDVLDDFTLYQLVLPQSLISLSHYAIRYMYISEVTFQSVPVLTDSESIIDNSFGFITGLPNTFELVWVVVNLD